MTNDAIKFLNSLVNDNTTKSELEIISYIKKCLKQSCSKRETAKEAYIKDLFSEFYKIYCKKGNKEQALKTWKKKLIKIKTEEEILQKARKIVKMYRAYELKWKEDETELKYIPLCSSWLNANVPD